MGKLVKRTEIMAFLNVSKEASSPVWKIIGNGMTAGTYSYEANETNETYIVNDNATTSVDSYAISLDGEMKCLYGDDVYDFINDIRYNLKVGTEAETTVLLIDKYDEVDEGFRAQVFDCSISITSYGGEGGATPTIGFKINVNGDPSNGTATMEGGVPSFVGE